jgi:hypothetical protein
MEKSEPELQDEEEGEVMLQRWVGLESGWRALPSWRSERPGLRAQIERLKTSEH